VTPLPTHFSKQTAKLFLKNKTLLKKDSLIIFWVQRLCIYNFFSGGEVVGYMYKNLKRKTWRAAGAGASGRLTQDRGGH
jgi:hypothetical protein